MFFHQVPKQHASSETLERFFSPDDVALLNSIPIETEIHPTIFWRDDDGPLVVDELATRYLAHHYHGRNPGTKRSVAASLVGYFNFLAGREVVDGPKQALGAPWEPISGNHAGRTPTTYLAATEGDFAAWQGYRKARCNSATFSKNQGAVVGFYDWLAAHKHIKTVPYRTRLVRTPVGSVEAVKGPKKIKGAQTSKLPFTPPEILDLRAALENPKKAGTAAGQVREPAIVRFSIGTGFRQSEVMNVTIYEIPPAQPGQMWVPFNVAGSTAKYQKGRRPDVAEPGLQAVRDYIVGDRADVLERLGGRQPKLKGGRIPIPVLEPTNNTSVTFVNPYTGQKEEWKWHEVPEDFRQRMVDSNGHPVIVWLTDSGTPFQPDSFRREFDKGVRYIARSHQFVSTDTHTPHSMRHTFAVMKATYLWRIGKCGDAQSAVQRVQFDLGHNHSETTVNTYLAAVDRLDDYDAQDIEDAF